MEANSRAKDQTSDQKTMANIAKDTESETWMRLAKSKKIVLEDINLNDDHSVAKIAEELGIEGVGILKFYKFTIELQGQKDSRSKRRKLEALAPEFNKEQYNFRDYLNASINNKNDTVLYERDDVRKLIIDSAVAAASKDSKDASKPTCVTVWSGRGSGKTSLIRSIALNSPEFDAQRNCGRLMVVDCHLFVTFVSRLKKMEDAEFTRLVPVLVAFHLCKIFGDSSVNGVTFTSHATIEGLWDNAEYIPLSLQDKLNLEAVNGELAYEWWRESTEKLDDTKSDPSPLIILDSAEGLCHVNNKPPTPPQQKELSDDDDDDEPKMTPKSTVKGGPLQPTPSKHASDERYLVLEWIMMKIPSQHAMIAVGTGARREFPRPADFHSHARHLIIPPLGSLSEEVALILYAEHKNKEVSHISPDEKRQVRTAYTVTTGLPRMLVIAYGVEGALFSTKNELWETRVSGLYEDASELISSELLMPSCLAKAIITCSVCNTVFEPGNTIPSEAVTWDYLRWRSIVFLSGKGYLQIPRLLWGRDTLTHRKLKTWVSENCRFELDDLVPSVTTLYQDAKQASATASGIFWEKLFSSALVGKFFVMCWKMGKDPAKHFVSLKDLLPQECEEDNTALASVEVCLGMGIKATDKETFASTSLVPNDFDWKAIHANWNIKSAHHDLVLPVRIQSTKEHKLWAVSARNGHRKTQLDLEKTKQRLVSKNNNTEVDGLIQAVNPRLLSKGRNFTDGSELSKMKNEQRYAEVSLHEGQAHYVLSCFP